MNRQPFADVPVVPRPPTPQPPTGVMATQPLITVGTITGLIAAASGVLVEFGLPITDSQESALEKLIVLGWPVAIVVWGWFRVYSFHSTQKVINEAAVAGSVGTEPPKV